MVSQFVWTVAMPLGVAIVCMSLAWQPWRRTDRERIRGWWGAPLGIGAGYLIGHVAINKWPSLPPAQPTDYLFLIALAGILVGLAESFRAPPAVRWTLRLALCGGVSWFMLSRGFRAEQPATVLAAWAVGQAAALAAVWSLLERLAARRSGPSLPLALSLLIAVAGAVLLKGGSAKLAQLAGVLAAALGGTALIAMAAPRISPARGLLAVVVPVYGALILLMWQYPQPFGVPLILAGAPLLLWVAEGRETVTAVLGRVLLAVTPVLVALILLLWHLLDEAKGESLY